MLARGYWRCGCLLAAVALTSCSEIAAPACPFQGEPDFGPSAGCLATVDRQLLLVEMRTGGMSPPGGSSLPGESTQCTAHRETWEETGLDLMPGRLLDVFETGFHLYHCQYYRNFDPLVARQAEVKRALWLPLHELETVSWRFAGQGPVLRSLAEQVDRFTPGPGRGTDNPEEAP